jgi:hypothetical protein
MASYKVVQAFEINDEIPTSEHTIGYHTKCFGLCCDFRKAVLVVNAIAIVIRIVQMAGVVYIAYMVDSLNNFDDDAFATSGDTDLAVAFLAIFEIAIGLCLNCIAIYGALKFKRWAIITGLIYYSCGLLRSLLFTGYVDVLSLILNVLFLYPHFYMFRLMSAGIMTKSNYPNIAQCCEC